MEAVYWTYVPRIESIVRHGFSVVRKGTYVRGSNGQEIRDLVQEVFARAFSQRSRIGYDGLREYGPYICRIARNVLADWARHSGRELMVDEIETDLAVNAPDDRQVPWAEEAVMRVTESYLSLLPPELVAVHQMRYVRNLPQHAAAKLLGLSRQQLRTLEARLRSGLAAALRHAGIEA